MIFKLLLGWVNGIRVKDGSYIRYSGRSGITNRAAWGLSLLLLTGVTQAQPLPAVSCQMTDFSWMNTGSNGSGGILAGYNTGNSGESYTRDLLWQSGNVLWSSPGTLNATPDQVASWQPAYVSYYSEAWLAPLSNATWIANEYDATQPNDSIDFFYKYSFVLSPSVDVSTFSLTFDFYADNSVQDVFVNGNSLLALGNPKLPQSSDPYYNVGFQTGQQASVTMAGAGLWQTGVNTVVVHVPSGPPGEGFMAQVSGTPTCLPSPASIIVSKTTSDSVITPLGPVSYALSVTNQGGVTATGVSITDSPPTDLTNLSWTCSASDGSSCPVDHGTGAIAQTGVSLPSGVTLSYTMTATAIARPGANVLNTLSVDPGSGSCADSSESPCTASVTLPTAPVFTPDISTLTPIPSLSDWGVLLLTTLTLLAGALTLRRRG